MKIILAIALVPFLIYFWPSALGGDTDFFVVQGQSMLPTILPGSIVITKIAPEYMIDDIVAFEQTEGRTASKIIVHRIIDETDNGFVIKGDNNPKRDPGFPTEDEILGKVLFATPYVGDLMGLLRQPVILVVAAAIMGAIQFGQKRKKDKKEKLRRIRLGITRSQWLSEKELKESVKKPDYNLFYVALAVNVIVLAVLEYSFMVYKIRAQGDAIMGFLFDSIRTDAASILVFGLYLGMLIGLYKLSKKYEKKLSRRKNRTYRKKSVVTILLGKNANTRLVISQFIWFMFILVSFFHLIAIGQDIMFEINCDPTVNLECR